MTNTNSVLGYEVGDDVYVFTSYYGDQQLAGPFKVTKVTPTGRITLSNGDQWLNHGRKVGDSGAWSRAFVVSKKEQDGRLVATKEQIRLQQLVRAFRQFRETLRVHVANKAERTETALVLENMAQELRDFDKEPAE